MDRAHKSLLTRWLKLAVCLVVLSAALGAGLLALLFSSGWALYSISGPSMEPTLSNGDSAIVKKSSVAKRGELIFFEKPSTWGTPAITVEEKHTVLVKRIVALPGDVLAFTGQGFTVNGESVFELGAYSCEKPIEGYSHELEEGELFVMGDNAEESLDSRRVFCDGETPFYVESKSILAHGKLIAAL